MMIVTKLCIAGIAIILEICIASTSTPNYVNETNHTSTFSHLRLKRRHFTRHAFYRSMDGDAVPGSPGSRRVFGGASAQLSEFPAVCALLDRYWSVRCTASVLADRWALTAAHCVTPRIAYVKYNTRRPASTDGNVTAVYFLYRHPKYEVEQKDEGRGMDVTRLHHDVGLVRTRDVMRLTSRPSLAAMLDTMRLLNPQSLYGQEVQVLGFGRTERSVLGEELFAVRLRLARCGRGAAWLHCACGAAAEPRGVCSGDSGGPVLHRGEPIGVTSMGPAECARGGALPADATSVFTTLQRYVDVINATVLDTERALRMRIVARAPGARRGAALAALCAAGCLLLHGVKQRLILEAKSQLLNSAGYWYCAPMPWGLRVN